MHPRVESMPSPQPDFNRFLAAVRCESMSRVPLIELAVHPTVVAALLDERVAVTACDVATSNVRLLHRMGYDVVKVSAGIPYDIAWSRSDTSDRNWQNQHAGVVESLGACDAFAWPAVADVDFSPVEAAAAVLPDVMKLIGFCGGVLEYATYLVGLERFMLATYDAPELVSEVCRRIGELLSGVFEAYVQMDAVCAIWLGDDLGSKNGLLVSPDLLEKHVFPWYERFVAIAHGAGKPFLLHSCGKTDTVMPRLIEQIGIDAKHSFEDAIEPVERFIDRWVGKVGVLGGIDVNLLSSGSEAAVATRVREVLEHAAARGGYACGSGNSITDYVPLDSYLTMVETAHRFNGTA